MSGTSTPLPSSATLTNAPNSPKSKLVAGLFAISNGQSPNLDVTACSVIEWIASHSSSTVFSYDLAEDSGFGPLTREWAANDPEASKLVSLQTRAGAGLTLVGRLSEGTSKDVQRGLALTAYTTPVGLAQMAPALTILPQPTASSRLVIQVASVTPVGPDLVVSPTLAPVFSALFSLPESFAVFLSSTPQESVELASLAYRLPRSHVVHVFDHYSSARETTHLVVPSPSTIPCNSVHDAFADLGYEFFDYAGDNEAHSVVVLLNGPLATAAKTLATQIPGLGVLVVRVLRPWDENAFRKILPATFKSVHVLDDVPSETAQGGLFVDVFSSLFDPTMSNAPTIRAHRNTMQTTQEYLSSPGKFASFLSGLLPSTFHSPTVFPTLSIAPSLKKLLFFSNTTCGISGLPLLALHTFLSHRTIKTRHLAVHDAFSKPGGITADRILLSTKGDIDDHVPMPCLLPLDASISEETEGEADFIGITEPSLLKTHSILKYARHGAPVLVLANWTPDEFVSNVPPKTLDLVRKRDLRVYTLNAKGLATDLLPDGENTRRDALENILSHLPFLRLYIGKEGKAGDQAVEKLARGSFGDEVEGLDLGVVCARAAQALQSVTVPPREDALPTADDSEVKHVSLKEFEFNTLAPDGDDLRPEVVPPKLGAWHDAAKQIIFREAFAPAPPSPIGEDPYVQDPALRPDLLERTYLVTTSVSRRLTPKEYDRNVFHLEFDTRGTGLKYEIGEALGVHGWNDTNDVLDFCKWYNADPDQLITINAPGRSEGAVKLKHTRTVFQALQQQVNIFGRPPKSFYGALSPYARERADRMSLHFIASPEGSATFKKLAEADTVSFADVLKMYESARPSIAELCELVGDICPRHYSIASSQAVVGDRVDLLVVTVDWVTPGGTRKYGQCTRYLADLKLGQQVTVSIKPGVMKLPPSPTQPIIMAGLGTGAAPFRAFMQHRAWLAAQNISVGPLLYYFGSRHRSQEYLYGEEIEAYVQDRVITHTGLAFSRDGKKKVYIQHKMKEDGEMLARHLNNDKAVFYLCGPTWPVPDVFEALAGALVKYVGQSEEEAAAYLGGLKEEERYVLEVY